MSTLERRTNVGSVLTSSAGDSAGNVMLLSAAASLPLLALAAVLPGGLLAWFVIFVVGGLGLKFFAKS